MVIASSCGHGPPWEGDDLLCLFHQLRAAGISVGKTNDYAVLFKSLFNQRFKEEGVLTLRIFPDFEAYTTYRTNALGHLSASRGASYCAPIKETLITIRSANDGSRFIPLETIKHELSHHMLHAYFGLDNLPTWLDEGLACYLGSWDMERSIEWNISHIPGAIEALHYNFFGRDMRKALAANTLISAHELMGYSNRQFHCPDTEKERMHYSQSWGLLCGLMATNDGRTWLNMLFGEISNGKPGLLEGAMRDRLDAYYRDYVYRIFR